MKSINSKTRKTNGANPTTWYKKYMLFENFMFNVLLNSNKGDTSKDDPLVLDENNNQHDPFEFLTNDQSKHFSFLRLLVNTKISKQLPSINGDINTITPPNNASQ